MRTETPPRGAQQDDRHIYQPQTPRRGSAVAAMFLCGFLFAIMGLTTKMTNDGALIGRTLPVSEVVACRFGFGALVMLPLQGRRGIQLLGYDRRGLVLRGIWGGFAVFFYFLSLQTTSLTHAQLLNYTSVIFAPVFAFFFLRERITPQTAAAVLIAVVGICLVTLRGSEAGGLNVGDAYGLISGLMAGAAITEIRRLRQTESAWSVFFYLSIVGMPMAIAAGLGLHEHPVWPTVAGDLVLLGMALSSVGGQILMTYGYKYVGAGEGSVIAMSQLVYSAVAGAVLFHEVFTFWTLLGGLLILGAALWMSGFRRGA